MSVSAKGDARVALAVDLGGTKASFAVVDATGAVRSRSKRASREGGTALTFEQLAKGAAETVRAARLEWTDVAAAGVVVPGIYDSSTGRAWAPNLWGPHEVPLRAELAERLPVPLTLDSDRSGYVVGERWMGAARGVDDVVFVAVGTGIGAGIVSGGRLVRGHGGVAGAVGWFAVDPRWKPIYGEVGGWEAEAAGPALARRAEALLAAGTPSALRDTRERTGGALSAEQVAEAARAGDEVARRAVEAHVEALALGIASLVSVLNPEIVVLGGGLMQARDLFLEPLRRAVPRWAQPRAARECRIEPTLLGEDAGLFGAARLALDASSSSSRS
jgi:glucokinase